MDQEGLELQGSQPLQCHLCVLEAQEIQGCHPGPACHPAQAFLCTLVQGGLSVQGAPQFLLVPWGLALQEVLESEDRNPHPQGARVHLCSLEGLWILFCLEVQAVPSLQVPQEGQVALEALGIPLVLSDHLGHHILGHPDSLEGLVGLGSQVVQANHGHLDHLSEGRRSQGNLEAQVLLLGHQGREVPSLQVDLDQECHL